MHHRQRDTHHCAKAGVRRGRALSFIGLGEAANTSRSGLLIQPDAGHRPVPDAILFWITRSS